MAIDLNADAGEIPALILDGSQEALLRAITSVNIACGGHAGDERTMRLTVEQARAHGVAIGAHPGYPDRENFGRNVLDMPPDAIADTVERQVRALARIASDLRHVKPHGALYNQAARDETVAAAIAVGVARVTRDVVLVGLAGSTMLDVFASEHFQVAAEAFADRRYEADGSLRARKHSGALILDADAAAAQALRIASDGEVTAVDGSTVRLYAQTICIHGDTPGAAAIAQAIRKRLADAGIYVSACT